MSIEALLERLADAIEKQTEVSERIVAGQQAALAKLPDNAGAAPKATRTRKPKEEAADAPEPVAEKNDTAAPAATESGAADAGNASDPEPTIEEVGAFLAAFADLDKDADARAARVGFVKEVAAYFYPNGGGMTAKQAVQKNWKLSKFFIERKMQGLPVDFGLEFDQVDEPEPAPAPAGGDFD